jgi:DNA-binding CsgD family transcriptional regulator
MRRPPPGQLSAQLAQLTERELEVLRLLARGLSNQEIAARLVVSEHTARTHVAHIFSKLVSVTGSTLSCSPMNAGSSDPERPLPMTAVPRFRFKAQGSPIVPGSISAVQLTLGRLSPVSPRRG